MQIWSGGEAKTAVRYGAFKPAKRETSSKGMWLKTTSCHQNFVINQFFFFFFFSHFQITLSIKERDAVYFFCIRPENICRINEKKNCCLFLLRKIKALWVEPKITYIKPIMGNVSFLLVSAIPTIRKATLKTSNLAQRAHWGPIQNSPCPYRWVLLRSRSRVSQFSLGCTVRATCFGLHGPPNWGLPEAHCKPSLMGTLYHFNAMLYTLSGIWRCHHLY